MRTSHVAILAGILALLSCACTERAPPPGARDLTLTLRWVKGYGAENKAKVETGLLWALSFLGAEFPRNAPKAFIWNDHLVTVDFDRIGLPAGARPSWANLVAQIEGSDEYRRTGGMDIGRFVMLTLCSPRNYYVLTGVAPHLEEVRARHAFDRRQMAVTQSEIAVGNRLIDIGEAHRFGEIGFIAYEGTGTIADGSFEKKEIEVLEFMKNGQLRFALYDLGGNLKTNASPALTSAGKPSKCLWCHEIRLQPAFKNLVDTPGYYTTQQFGTLIAERMKLVDQYRERLDSRVDFKRTQDHTFAELLYLTFMEPSAERLALEWNLPVEQVTVLLKAKPTHKQEEFAWLGSRLYRRQDVDALAPYPVIKVASDPRELSTYEPEMLGSEELAQHLGR